MRFSIAIMAIPFPDTNMYCDLHMHLYGCISPELLFKIGRKNPAPSWERFLPGFENVFGIKINPHTFFQEYADAEKFRNLYLFLNRYPFSHFQAKFNLIIALSRFDNEEIRNMPGWVRENSPDLSFAEYRIMYSPHESNQGYIEKTISACQGMAESDSRGLGGGISLSLHRTGDFENKYDLVKELMEKEDVVRKYLHSIDFCNIEEGNPPSTKETFFNKVIVDNKAEPATALAILYHVGESFTDKSPLSAARWVIESSRLGAHRLGHAIALGMEPDSFLGKRVTESVQERKNQVLFELQHYEQIRNFGEIRKKEALLEELKQLCAKNPSQLLQFLMDEKYLDELRTFQEWGMSELKNQGTVIESCPTSNLRIGMIENISHHPVRRFAERGMSLTIGTDDPGIFATDIKQEYRLAGETGISPEKLEEIRKNSFHYKSTVLSGREKSMANRE